MNIRALGVASALVLGVALTADAGRKPVTYASQIADARAAAVAYLNHGSPHGPLMNPGTPDQAVMVNGRVVQLEYIGCIYRPDVRWYEDGSAECDK